MQKYIAALFLLTFATLSPASAAEPSPTIPPSQCTPEEPGFAFVKAVRGAYKEVLRTGRVPRVCLWGHCASCKWNEVSFKCTIKTPKVDCDVGCNSQGCWDNCSANSTS